MANHPVRMLTMNEVASILRVSRRTVWKYVDRGTIPSTKLGSKGRRGSPVLIPEPAIISLCGTARYLR